MKKTRAGDETSSLSPSTLVKKKLKISACNSAAGRKETESLSYTTDIPYRYNQLYIKIILKLDIGEEFQQIENPEDLGSSLGKK